MRIATGAVVVGTATIALVGAVAPSASAVIVPEYAEAYVVAIGDVFDVCGSGRSASATNLWRIQVSGVRHYDAISSEESSRAQPTGTSQAVIGHSASGSGRVFDVCFTVGKLRANAGQFVVTLTYVGAGPDVAVALVGEGTWAGSFANGTGTRWGSP